MKIDQLNEELKRFKQLCIERLRYEIALDEFHFYIPQAI